MLKIFSPGYIIFLNIFFFSFPLLGQTIQNPDLSPQAEVSLITCAPGKALFEAFGHTAIRVHDPVSGFDMAYNYGVFDFDQPNFYLNFAKGYLLYKLGTADFQRFLYQYTYFDRGVKEQVLNLSEPQKQAVFNFLQINSLPENREYYYDYFYDNCSTRPRDVFIEILGDSLQFDYGYADTLDYTIRGLIDRYIENKDQYAWGDLGIDLGLGATIDLKASPFEYMYQPEFLFLAFEGATLVQSDGSIKPFVTSTKTLYEAKASSDITPHTFTPTLVFWTLLLLISILTVIEFRYRKYRLRWLDILFFTLLGLYGFLVFFLWFFTNHHAAAYNWNIIWGWPTHLMVSCLLFLRHPPHFLKYYFFLSALLSGFILFFWAWFPQDLHTALIPILLLIIIRSIAITQVRFSKLKKLVVSV